MAIGFVTEAQIRALDSVAHRLDKKGLRDESRALRRVLEELQGSPERRSEVPAAAAAEILAVTPQTVRNWVRAGVLPGRRDPTGHFLVNAEALEPALRMRRALPDVQDTSFSESEIDDEIEAVRAARRRAGSATHSRQR